MLRDSAKRAGGGAAKASLKRACTHLTKARCLKCKMQISKWKMTVQNVKVANLKHFGF